MLSQISMAHFKNQIKEELSKLDERFIHLKETDTFNSLDRRESLDSTSTTNSPFLPTDLGCDVCPEHFKSPAQLILHQKTHTGQIPCICNFCLKSFALKENLASHACSRSPLATSLQDSLKCKKCDKCQKVYSQGIAHRCNTTTSCSEGVVPRIMPCKVCKKNFSDVKHLKVHMRSHHNTIKPFRCRYCNKSFAYSHVLKMHQVQHYSSRVYQCTLCQTTFATKKEMETHIMQHDSEDIMDRPLDEAVVVAGVAAAPRPSSTGSFSLSAASSTCTDRSNSPAAVNMRHHSNLLNNLTPMEIAKCRPSNLILPSINSIYSDEDVKSLPNIVRSSPKISVVKHNPVFPITDSLMSRLMAEDKENFGHLPAVSVPSLEDMLPQSLRQKSLAAAAAPAAAATTTAETQQEEPMDLSKSHENDDDEMKTVEEPERAVSPPVMASNQCPPPVITSSSTTFSKMEKTSLPPIKRRLAAADLNNRGSVIQFALKPEH